MARIRSQGIRILFGAALACSVIAVVETVSRWVVYIPNAGVFFLMSVAFAGFLWGMSASLAAVPMAILASLYIYAEPGQWMVYTHANVVRMIVLAVGSSCTAILVGQLKRNSDRSLWASEDRYRALVESTPDAVLVQQNGLIIYANAAAHEAFCARPDSGARDSATKTGTLIGSSIWDRLHPDSHDVVRSRIRLLSSGSEGVPPIEETWVRMDKSTFVAEVAAKRVLIEHRPAVLVLLHDLTRRREMESRIHRQVRDLSLLQEVSRAFLFGLSSAEIPQYICAIVGERTGVSRAWVAMVDKDGAIAPAPGGGCDAAEMLATGAGPSSSDAPLDPVLRSVRLARPVVVQDVTKDPFLAPLHDITRQPGYRATAAFPLISGEQVVAVLSVYHPEPGGLSEALVLLVQSLVNLAAIALGEAEAQELIARRAQGLELAVVERTAALHAAATEMKAFTYSVSHDLRAPLRAIGGFSEILVRRYSESIPPDGRHYLANIVDATAHMSKLIDDLLSYARLGRRGVEIQRVDLARLLGQIMTDLEGRITAKAACVKIPAELPLINTDPTLLRQILTNLLDNALTYHAPGQSPQVELTCETQPGAVVLRVVDRGIGITPDQIDSIFNLFQRLHSADEFPGTGIGLAIVRKSALLLNGTVSAESILGKGSTFTVTLPISEEASRFG